MIYLLSNNSVIDSNFIIELKNEFLKAKIINIFCHEDNKTTITNLLHENLLENKLIKVYFHKLNVRDKKIFNIISEEDIEIMKEIKGFNYPQYLASVLAADKSLLINAGAGTGKTTTVVETVLNLLLNRDAELEDILLTTFTNNATDDIYEKIYRELKDRWKLTGNKRCLYLLENINLLTICTLHKYLRTILGELGSWYGYSDSVSMGSFNDRLRQCIDNVIKDEFEITTFDSKDYGVYDITLRNIITDIVTDEKVDVSRINNYHVDKVNDSLKVKNLARLILLTANKISQELMEKLIDEDKVLTNDINYKLEDMLCYDGNFESKLKRYKYIFVDECQDTSTNQFEILRKLLEITNSKLFAVGDTLQAIYRFRSADPNSMNNFKKVVDMKLHLIENYRTKKELLDKINDTFIALKGNEYTRLNANSSGSQGIVIRNFNWNNKNDSLVKILKDELPKIENKRKNQIEKNNKENRIAILVRNNNDAKKIFKELCERGIECNIEKGGSLFQSKAARELLALIRVILYPNSNVYKSQLLDTNYCKFNVNITASEFLKEYNFNLIDVLLEAVKAYVNKDKTAFNILTDIIYNFDPSRDDISYRENLLLILEEFINRGITSSFSDMEQFLSMNLNLNIESKSSEELHDEDKVIISTFHSTKGLEFDTVIILADYCYIREFETSNNQYDIIIDNHDIGICYKTEEKVRSVNQDNEDKLIKSENYNYLKQRETMNVLVDEQNLLYVAMTRAKENLYILTPTKILDNTHAKILQEGGLINGGSRYGKNNSI